MLNKKKTHIVLGGLALITLPIIFTSSSCNNRVLPNPGIINKIDVEKSIIQDLEQELKKVSLEVIFKPDTRASEIKSEEIKLGGFNRAKYSIVEKTLKTFDTYIEISFKLRDDINRVISETKTITVSGLRREISLEVKIDNELYKVKADVENKKNLTVSEITINQVKFSDFNEIEYQIIDQTISKYDKDSIEISFKLKNKKHSLYSNERIIKIDGFKEMSNESKTINEEIKKIEVALKNPITTLQELLEKQEYGNYLNISNFDQEKYQIIESAFEKVDSDPFSVHFTFKIEEKNKGLISTKRTIKLSVKNKIKDELETFLKDIDIKRKNGKSLLKYDIHELTEEIIKNDMEFDFSETNGKTLESEKISLSKISFSKSNIELTNKDYNSGIREIICEFTKENIKVTKNFSILVHFTDKEIILDQEFLATNAFELIKNQNIDEYYEKIKKAAMEDGGNLSYDSNKKVFTDFAKNELFKLKESISFKDKTTFGYIFDKFKSPDSAKLEFDPKTNKITIKYYLVKQSNANVLDNPEDQSLLFGKKEIIGLEVILKK
ncbi:hypothetical protein ACJA25_02140 [Mycoplasmopsis hyopharyngis]|uniref:hypothetical protein n=1 Tax=Mycoplasmopsis hyopharyngis TaxID=29558 RepID=UPI003873926B